MGTDKYAYGSALKTVDPRAKLLLTSASIFICVISGSIACDIATVIFMCAISALAGGTRVRVFMRYMLAPCVFLLIGCLTIIVGRYPYQGDIILGCNFSGWYYGITRESVISGFSIAFRALGIIASVYFLVLNTPMTDLSWAMQRLRVPRLMLEIMDLMYRYIFVFMDTMKRIKTAQESRLGYSGMKKALNSAGTLWGAVFIRAFRKSDRLYAALEARGYMGSLSTIEREYDSGRRIYYFCALAVFIQLAAFILERMVLS